MRIGRDVEEYCLDGLWLYHLVPGVGIYLVSSETIDRLCPYERRCGIPLERIDSVRASINVLRECQGFPESRAIDSVFRELDSWSTTFSVMGCFIADSYRAGVREMGIETPAILIAPERVYSNAKEIASELGVDVGKVFKHLMRAVLAHELTHAVTWRFSYGKTYYRYREQYVRFLEECVAQLSAYLIRSRNDGYIHSLVVDRASQRAPVEYNLWRALLPKIKTNKHLYLYIQAYSSTMAEGKIHPLMLLLMLPAVATLYSFRHVSIRYAWICTSTSATMCYTIRQTVKTMRSC